MRDCCNLSRISTTANFVFEMKGNGMGWWVIKKGNKPQIRKSLISGQNRSQLDASRSARNRANSFSANLRLGGDIQNWTEFFRILASDFMQSSSPLSTEEGGGLWRRKDSQRGV